MRRALVLMLLGLLLPAFAPQSAGAAVSYCDGGAYIVQAADSEANSSLLRFDPLTGTTTRVADLPAHLNALAASDQVFYAIARPGTRAVRLTMDGKITPLGPISGAPRDNFAGAYAGAVAGGRWMVMHDDRVYAIAVDRQPLTVIGSAALSKRIRIGDWAADARGRLLAISTISRPSTLVSIDPETGSVTELGHPAGLPGGSTFGAMWVLGEDLYALHNSTSTIYRLNLNNPSSAIAVATGLGTASWDGASCAALPAPPPPAIPSPPPSPAPVVPPAIAPIAEMPPPLALATPTPPPTSPAPAPSPPLARPPLLVRPPLPFTPPRLRPPATPAPPGTVSYVKQKAVAVEQRASKTRTRRWVAAAIVVLTMAGLFGLRSQSSRQ